MTVYLLDFNVYSYEVFSDLLNREQQGDLLCSQIFTSPPVGYSFDTREAVLKHLNTTMWQMLIAGRWNTKRAIPGGNIDEAKSAIRNWCRNGIKYELLIETNKGGDVVAIAPLGVMYDVGSLRIFFDRYNDGENTIRIHIAKARIDEALALSRQDRAYYYDPNVRVAVDLKWQKQQERVIAKLSSVAESTQDQHLKQISARFVQDSSQEYAGNLLYDMDGNSIIGYQPRLDKDEYLCANRERLQSILETMHSNFFPKGSPLDHSASDVVKQYVYRVITHGYGDCADDKDTIKAIKASLFHVVNEQSPELVDDTSDCEAAILTLMREWNEAYLASEYKCLFELTHSEQTLHRLEMNRAINCALYQLVEELVLSDNPLAAIPIFKSINDATFQRQLARKFNASASTSFFIAHCYSLAAMDKTYRADPAARRTLLEYALSFLVKAKNDPDIADDRGPVDILIEYCKLQLKNSEPNVLPFFDRHNNITSNGAASDEVPSAIK